MKYINFKIEDLETKGEELSKNEREFTIRRQQTSEW